MKINGINNLNQYTTIMTKQSKAQNKINKTVEQTTPLVEAAKVEVSTISDADKAEKERRAYWDSVSPTEALKMAIANAPNNDDVEQSKALSAKFIPIQQKLRAGKQLSPAEKSFIQENYPELYAQAMQIEQEVQQLKARLQKSNSKEEANQIYMETKMRVMGAAGNDNGLSLGMIPALDNIFRNM